MLVARQYSVYTTVRTCSSILAAGTPYEGGMFRMKLVLSKDFPASPPQGKSTVIIPGLSPTTV